MRRLKILSEQQQDPFTLWNVGRQRREVAFDQGPVVSDAGLLAVRALERPLGILAELAQRLPDPRSALFVQHSTERLLTQQVYQILAGCPDGNDADELRHDALFQILAEVTPTGEQPLASGSTLARFPYAHTRRGQRQGEAEILLVRRFCANAWRLLVHVVAYVLVVLFREANARVPEVARAEVSTLRQRLWKVPAVLASGARRRVLRLHAAWPYREVFGRVLGAVGAFVGRLAGRAPAGFGAAAALPL